MAEDVGGDTSGMLLYPRPRVSMEVQADLIMRIFGKQEIDISG